MTKSHELDSTVSPNRFAPRAPEPGQHRWDGHMADDVGSTFGPEPMAYLSATADEIVLSGSRGTYRLARAATTKIGRGRMYPWFFSAVRIHHTVESLPSELQFKPLGLPWRQVVQTLRELGYPCA